MMTFRQFARVALLLTTALAMSACGSSSMPGSSSTESTNPESAPIASPAPDEPFANQILGLKCTDLLTADEISRVLGHKVWAARSTSDMRLGPPTGLNCNFQTKDDLLNNFTMVIRPLDAKTRQRFGIDKNTKAAIPGLGDRASAGANGKGADVIAAGPGFILWLSGDAPYGISRDQMIAIAQLAYGRLTA